MAACTPARAESLEACGFEVRAQIIWAKERLVHSSRGDYHWQHEPCWYAVRRRDGHWTRRPQADHAVADHQPRQDAGHGHGTQKPVECMRRPIENNSSPGQAVYEPFCGSGTTIIAAEMTGRGCHAIELTPAYVDVAVGAGRPSPARPATRVGGGTFAEAEAAQQARAA